jgi:hypothetical protein
MAGAQKPTCCGALRPASTLQKCYETCAQVSFGGCGDARPMIPFCPSIFGRHHGTSAVRAESLRFGAKRGRPMSLDELHALIDWEPAARALASLYPSGMGEKAWPPLAMFKALCSPLGMICRMWGLPRRSVTARASAAALPAKRDARTLVRFRRELGAQGLDKSLFEAIARDREQKGACAGRREFRERNSRRGGLWRSSL